MIREKEKRDLNNLKADYYNSFFSHIYVEKSVADMPDTVRILNKFPQSHIIYIDHYKDVFCRSRQSSVLQHRTQNLIIAKKENNLVYAGAPVCQSFGNEHFYYTSCMMNCVFDCEYCYLKGMYPSGNLVVFVNLEDYFEELDRLLSVQSMYVCVSYDADLLALEEWMGYAREWVDYAAKNANLKLEIRTKSARKKMWDDLPVLSNVVYAFTVSPQKMIVASERNTPSAEARIACAAEGIRRGFPVRFCFDPILYLPGWKVLYQELFVQIDEVFAGADCSWGQLDAVSVGGFRISKDYMKKIRRVEKDSPIVQFPYVNVGGVYQYPPKLLAKMENCILQELEKRMLAERIYRDSESM